MGGGHDVPASGERPSIVARSLLHRLEVKAHGEEGLVGPIYACDGILLIRAACRRAVADIGFGYTSREQLSWRDGGANHERWNTAGREWASLQEVPA